MFWPPGFGWIRHTCCSHLENWTSGCKIFLSRERQSYGEREGELENCWFHSLHGRRDGPARDGPDWIHEPGFSSWSLIWILGPPSTVPSSSTFWHKWIRSWTGSGAFRDQTRTHMESQCHSRELYLLCHSACPINKQILKTQTRRTEVELY